MTPASTGDLAAVAEQLGRPPRGVAGVAWRCPCGRPGVIATAPRLGDGTPFPTLYYLTCPRAVAACSRLEANGLMAAMHTRLTSDDELRAAYQTAHRAYLTDRAGVAARLGVPDVPHADVSAGGMPDRVKCLHALAGHALAAGPGVNPLGDEVVAAIGDFWREPCLPPANSGTRVGVIDCGTNTVRLLIADARPTALTDVVRELRFVRLGQGVDATHQFHPAALARTFAALDEYAGLIAQHGPLDGLVFLATSAARDVTNRDVFFAGVEQRLGVTPSVITGAEEAKLSFLGALAGGPVVTEPVLVIDIGGGSTELILGGAGGDIQVGRSLNIGSVRLRERFLLDDPPTVHQVQAARRFVADLLDTTDLPWRSAATFIGVAGTSTSLSAMNMGLTTYDVGRVNNSELLVSDVAALADHLLASPVADVRTQYPILEPMRAEVICAGALIAAEIATRVGRTMLVRETDILDGAAKALVAQRQRQPT